MRHLSHRGWMGLLMLLVAITSGCANTAQREGQKPTAIIEGPNLYDWKRQKLLETITIPVDATVVIYLHGTKNPVNAEDCGIRSNLVPHSIHSLAARANTFVFFHCSQAIDKHVEGSYIANRGVEIVAVLNQLQDAGIPPRNIFLAGHSAGGWVALMLSAEHADKFNAAIAFAPACCGRRDLAVNYPRWREKVRPQQVDRMLRAERIDALVFAYADDDFNRPSDLGFLTERYPETIRLLGYNCEGGHNTHIDDCQVEQTSVIIRNYIAARQAQHGEARVGE